MTTEPLKGSITPEQSEDERLRARLLDENDVDLLTAQAGTDEDEEDDEDEDDDSDEQGATDG